MREKTYGSSFIPFLTVIFLVTGIISSINLSGAGPLSAGLSAPLQAAVTGVLTLTAAGLLLILLKSGKAKVFFLVLGLSVIFWIAVPVYMGLHVHRDYFSILFQGFIRIRDRGVTCTDIVRIGAVKEDPAECASCTEKDLSPSKCGRYKNIKNNYIYRLKEKLELLEIGTILPAGNRLRHDGWKIRYFDDIRASYRRPPADILLSSEPLFEQGAERL